MSDHFGGMDDDRLAAAHDPAPPPPESPGGLPGPMDEFGSFLDDIASAVAAVVETISSDPGTAEDDWFFDRECLAWSWLPMEERVMEAHN